MLKKLLKEDDWKKNFTSKYNKNQENCHFEIDSSIFNVNEKKIGCPKTFAKLYEDIIHALVFNFIHYDIKTNEQFPIKNCGFFFPKIVAHPEDYITNNFNCKEFLLSLKKKGKTIVLITNSAYEFSNLILEYGVGKDYLNYCDVVIYYSKKPNFFNLKSKNEVVQNWYFLDETFKDHKGKEIFQKDYELLKSYKKTVLGNFECLDKFCHFLNENKKQNYLVVGDSFFSDCLKPNSIKNVDSCYLLSTIETKNYLKIHIPLEFGKKWGKFFNFCDQVSSFSFKNNINEDNEITDNTKTENKDYFGDENRLSMNITLYVCKQENIKVIPHVEYLDFLSN